MKGPTEQVVRWERKLLLKTKGKLRNDPNNLFGFRTQEEGAA
jgi:hypothetical protein